MKKIIFVVFALFSLASIVLAADLRICPSCGREDEVGVEKCPGCGTALPPVGNKEPLTTTYTKAEDKTQKNADVSVNALAEASADVQAARKCREKSPAKALAIFQNAMALLAVESGADFKTSAAAAIASEIESSKALLQSMGGGLLARRAALQQGVRDAELYYRSLGRVQVGRVWIPSDWNEKLSPLKIAAIRQSLPPECRSCAGIGFDVCSKCDGRGRVQCGNKGCQQGWIAEQSANDLSPKTALKTRHKCPVCKGSSLQHCQECKGTGAVICKKCAGTGAAPVCTSCQGSGLTDCRDCRRKGGGSDLCPACRGTKKTLCRRCGGDGRIPR